MYNERRYMTNLAALLQKISKFEQQCLTHKCSLYQYVSTYLRIRDLTVDDSGIYRCVVEDKNGCSVAKEAKVTVLDIKRHNECK